MRVSDSFGSLFHSPTVTLKGTLHFSVNVSFPLLIVEEGFHCQHPKPLEMTLKVVGMWMEEDRKCRY